MTNILYIFIFFIGVGKNIFQSFENGIIYDVNEYFAPRGLIYRDYQNFYNYFRGAAA